MINNKENIEEEISTELELSNLKEEIISNVEIHDWDPENPYHYHTTDGKKVVITPEDWEKYKDNPVFREVRAAVEREWAACPGPEYEINSNFIKSLRQIYSSSFGDNYHNYKNFGKYLPEGYSFTPEGVIIGPNGTAYVQSGFRQYNRFTYSTDNSLQFTIYKGKPIERKLIFYPINIEKMIKPPLPIDKVMDVGEEIEKAINNIKYIHKGGSQELPIFLSGVVLSDGRKPTFDEWMQGGIELSDNDIYLIEAHIKNRLYYYETIVNSFEEELKRLSNIKTGKKILTRCEYTSIIPDLILSDGRKVTHDEWVQGGIELPYKDIIGFKNDMFLEKSRIKHMKEGNTKCSIIFKGKKYHSWSGELKKAIVDDFLKNGIKKLSREEAEKKAVIKVG